MIDIEKVKELLNNNPDFQYLLTDLVQPDFTVNVIKGQQLFNIPNIYIGQDGVNNNNTVKFITRWLESQNTSQYSVGEQNIVKDIIYLYILTYIVLKVRNLIKDITIDGANFVSSGSDLKVDRHLLTYFLYFTYKNTNFKIFFKTSGWLYGKTEKQPIAVIFMADDALYNVGLATIDWFTKENIEKSLTIFINKLYK